MLLFRWTADMVQSNMRALQLTPAKGLSCLPMCGMSYGHAQRALVKHSLAQA